MATTRPPLNERIYAPYKIAALVEVLAEQGIAAADSLRGVGVSAEELQDASVLTSIGQYATVCRNAVALSCEPATPFKVGGKLHLSAYGMYGYALMSCLSLRDYFKLGVRYHRLATPTVAIEWTEYPDRMVWTFPDAFISSPSRELREFIIEQQYTQHVTHLQDVAGSVCPPVKACFSYPAPAHADIYPKYLGCPCYFDQPQCELVYDSAILDRKPQLAHKLTAALLQETCDRLIGQAKTSSGVSGEVYQVLMSTPGVFPGMEAVAESMHLTTRTLRRRLDEEGTSFVAIVDDVKRSLALEYLKTTKMSTDDVAMLLGFSDAANFRRALKRWTGKGPGELRR
ncbi:AraC family transcriptional regulator ligand-binding domain-containing protein [Caballeronia sp. LP006]|jgi:AraC-like DNA-binding protein|uniref:AraC family transcriptional regulator ligand-binding domain-containing protein n=1 Tax=unclassified Caballeronia TaxID=2646786 RepID=UPI002027F4E0|nr:MULTISPECIES: AraC family transcriptional regulator ligand-binding domain-containing protein [unclassified Caballeronia]MDR5806212.1 AraC family transcriptional regulator ligand-binding domain-containing protein [Caballeronia sp. LZ001]MDR5826661.1 AraC family transcriptional regulator ligand-binding domain-containing protein [Caballeronia sp. LP006]